MASKQLQENLEQREKELQKAQEEALNELIPEAFAAVREASKRVFGKNSKGEWVARHFDEQLIGGMVLHQGKIAEMKTGEGKTLVATLPLYLNALTGKGAHLITVNDYLAKRDPHWMGPIYYSLGVSVASIQHEEAFIFDRSEDFFSGDTDWPYFRKLKTRQEAYQADITYGTNNEFGFDYLRDNMVVDLKQCVQRDLNYAIVDEVDNILIDEARTPLIISGPAAEGSLKKYISADQVARQLTGKITTDQDETDAKFKHIDIEEGQDYLVDEKNHNVRLTGEGVSKAQNKLNVEDVREFQLHWEHYIRQAIIANVLYKKNREYIVNNGKVIIVDEFTGRIMEGRRYSDGLHQAIEAKERVDVLEESRTYATITFQNYFRMYRKLAGMTGTAITEAEEFHKIYKLEVVQIPTHNPMIRNDIADRIYKNEAAKFRAVAKQVEELHKQNIPVLIGTVSVEKSVDLDEHYLRPLGIKSQRLNAKDHASEAEIIAQAGQLGKVTVATNMAGRGVDIILGGNAEGIVRAKLKKWTYSRVEKESGGKQKTLEDLEIDYKNRIEQIETEYAQKIKELEDTKNKANELLVISESYRKTASAFFERFEQIEKKQPELIGAEDRNSEFPVDYNILEEDLERALFEEAHRLQSLHNIRGIREKLHDAEKAAEQYDAKIQEYNKNVLVVQEIIKTLKSKVVEESAKRQIEPAEGKLAGTRVVMDNTRSMWLKLLKELDVEILRNLKPQIVQEYDKAKETHSQSTENLEKELNNRERDLKREEEKHHKKVDPLKKDVGETWRRIENGSEYRQLFDDLLKQESPGCILARNEVVKLGGLYVIGTERHEARRIDLQLRGRSGRQGDPGSTRFYVSLEDDIMRRFGGDRVGRFMEWAGLGEDVPIENSIVNKTIESAQVRVEGYHFDLRKHLVEYDDVVNHQREIIYGERRKILNGADVKANILSMVKEEAAEIISAHTGENSDGNLEQLVTEAAKIMSLPQDFNAESLAPLKPGEIEDKLMQQAEFLLNQKENEIGPDYIKLLERVLINRIDSYWIDHLTSMDNMRQGIGLQAIGSTVQDGALHLYKREGHGLFEAMTTAIRHDVAHIIFNLNITKGPPPAKQTASPMTKVTGATHGGNSGKPTEKVAGKKVGRNDPCPCGSGKKYKHCCGQ
jgi:preprotein translocase SecA subunit